MSCCHCLCYWTCDKNKIFSIALQITVTFNSRTITPVNSNSLTRQPAVALTWTPVAVQHRPIWQPALRCRRTRPHKPCQTVLLLLQDRKLIKHRRSMCLPLTIGRLPSPRPVPILHFSCNLCTSNNSNISSSNSNSTILAINKRNSSNTITSSSNNSSIIITTTLITIHTFNNSTSNTIYNNMAYQVTTTWLSI